MGKINTDNYPNRPFSSYQDDDMFILQDNGGETYTTNVGDVKNLADSRIKLEGVKVNGTDLPITDKKVNVDISGKTDLSVIAYTFNSEMGYFKGAYVTYNGKLYEFIQEHTGAWNPSHVREIRASGQYVRTGNGGYNNGDRATCEGYMTKASGNYSHAEGRETQAVGDCTHAEGRETIANGIYQHVEGKYNIADNENKYIHIIGNGIDDNNRSNAMTLDWDGNLEVSGDVEDGNGEKISDKTDKVTNATSGHLAGLDSNGNLTDSGVSPTEDVTVEGNPVTFESPFEQDAKSVVVSVKPIQDLHGYDKPWSGGAGKNKWDVGNNINEWIATSDNGVTIVSNGDISSRVAAEFNASTGSIKVTNYNNSGWWWMSKEIKLAKNTNYKAINLPTTNKKIVGISSLAGGTTGTEIAISDGAFNSGDYDYWLVSIYPYQLDVTNTMIMLSTETDSTFAPYSNICPISGRTEVNLGRIGRNIWDEQWAIGDIDGNTGENKVSSNYVRSTYVSISPQTVYYMRTSTTIRNWLYFYDANMQYLGFSTYVRDETNKTFTSPANAYYMRFLLNINDYGQSTYKNDLCVNISDDAFNGQYEPYAGKTYTIALGDTIYGGTVDFDSGVMTVTYAIDTYDGSNDEEWTIWQSGGHSFRTYTSSHHVQPPNNQTIVTTSKCNELALDTPTNTYDSVTDYTISTDMHASRISIVVNSTVNTTALLRKWLAEHPLQLCYELATPTTLSLTPTDVELLEGTNVVSTNGEKVAVTFGRSLWQDIDELKTDTEGKLDKSNVADVEGDTASRAYSVNEFMLRADGFYKVTQPIASGASITASNTTKTTIGAVLTALLNA